MLEFLDMMISNVQTPYVLWNDHTRDELEQLSIERLRDGEYEVAYEFMYAVHKQELQLGTPIVFVRNYNKNPHANLPSARNFLGEVLHQLNEDVQAVKSKGPNEAWKRSQQTGAVLDAVHGLVCSDPALAERILSLNRFPLLFSVLAPQFSDSPELQLKAIKALCVSAAGSRCADSIGTGASGPHCNHRLNSDSLCLQLRSLTSHFSSRNWTDS